MLYAAFFNLRKSTIYVCGRIWHLQKPKPIDFIFAMSNTRVRDDSLVSHGLPDDLIISILVKVAMHSPKQWAIARSMYP